MEYVSRLLSLDLDVTGLENIPTDRRLHHRRQSSDRHRRRRRRLRCADARAAGHRDLHQPRRDPHQSASFRIPHPGRVAEELRDRTKMHETLQLSSRAFSEGAGGGDLPLRPHRLSGTNGRLNERPWQSSAITLARKQGVPIVPVNVQSRNSGLFYWFANWSTELRDMTVFHELLNKRGKTFRIRFGPLIPQERFAEGDAAEVTERLQAHVVERP